MEAATALERSLARDHVAREAGVSRGLLHYYLGTKERLLVEVVRRECEVRGELLDQAVAGAAGADEVIDALVRSLEEILGEGTSAMVTFYELLMLGQRNDASFVFAPADGVTIRRLSEPKLDVRPLMDQAVAAARALLA